MTCRVLAGKTSSAMLAAFALVAGAAMADGSKVSLHTLIDATGAARHAEQAPVQAAAAEQEQATVQEQAPAEQAAAVPQAPAAEQTAVPQADEQKSVEPVIPEIVDPNPYASYSAGMASDKAHPMAYEWQKANEDDIEDATDNSEIESLCESDESIAALLAKVGPAYTTDPLAATQIAAVSQRVMCTKCPKSSVMRTRWTAALLEAARTSKDEYRTLFFLDQLRWCAYCDEAEKIRAIGAASGKKRVMEFADMVARELDSVK